MASVNNGSLQPLASTVYNVITYHLLPEAYISFTFVSEKGIIYYLLARILYVRA